MMRESLAAFLLGVFVVIAFSPERTAQWVHDFQTALFAARMEVIE